MREDNKVLEGKIEEQKKTKKFLKDLFLQQTTNKMEKPSKEQLDMINEASSEDEEEEVSDVSDSLSDDDDDESDEGTSQPKRRRK